MNKENRQYLLVGIFVVLASSILIAVWLWFSSNDHKHYNTYLAVFHEPVDGITTNSIVKYNGVEVGRVKLISLDNTNPHNILIYLNILEHIPINADTYATMKSQGITGLSYVEMILPINSHNPKNLTPHNSEPYPQIKTKSSFLYNLTEQAQSGTNNVKDVSGQIKILLNETNLTHATNILSNLDKISTSIANRSTDITKSMTALSQLITNIRENTQDLHKIMQNISELSTSLIKTTNNTNSLVTTLEKTTVHNFNSTILPNLNSAIEHIDQSSYQLEQLLVLLNQNPTALIRGTTKTQTNDPEIIGEK